MPEEDLKKLPPEERIKRLKELEQKKKKEIEDAQKQIKESEKELSEKVKTKQKVPIPEVAVENLKNLSDAEKDIVKQHRGFTEKKKDDEEISDKTSKPKRKENLEDTLGGEKAPRVSEHQFGDYIARLSQQPVKDLYAEMSRINHAVADKGYINAAEERRVEYLNSAMERKLEDVNAGKYSFTEDVAQSASLIQQIGSSLRDVYQRGKGRKSNEMYR